MSDLVTQMQRKIDALFENKCRLVRDMEREIDNRMKLTATIEQQSTALAKARARVAEFAVALKNYMNAVQLMNDAMRDGINVHGALSSYVSAEEDALFLIARATLEGEG